MPPEEIVERFKEELRPIFAALIAILCATFTVLILKWTGALTRKQAILLDTLLTGLIVLATLGALASRHTQ